MRYIRRQLEEQVLHAVKGFPAVVLTGPRRAGKMLLLRRLFPKASYFLLEDPDVVARLRADPRPSITAGGNTNIGCLSRRAGAAVAGISRRSVTTKQA